MGNTKYRPIRLGELQLLFDREFNANGYNYINFNAQDLSNILYWFNERMLSISDVKEIVKGAKAIIIHQENAQLISNNKRQKYVDFSSMNNFNAVVGMILKESDTKIFREVQHADSMFKSFYINNDIISKQFSKYMNQVWARTIEVTSQANKTITDFTQKSVNLYVTMAALYESIINHINLVESKDKADLAVGRAVDGIILNHILKYKTIYTKFIDYEGKVSDFNGFLDKIMTEGTQDERFDKNEVVNLLTRTSSIIADATAKKWNRVSKALSQHIKLISEHFNDQTICQNFTPKKLMLKAGTIYYTNPANLVVTSNLLIGKNITESILALRKNEKEIINGSIISDTRAREYVLYKKLPNLKIVGIDKDINTYILSNRVSTLTDLTVNSVYDTTDELTTCLCMAYGIPETNLAKKLEIVKKLGYNMETIYTKDNLFDLFPSTILKRVYICENNSKVREREYSKICTTASNNIVANTKTLRKLLTAKEIQKVYQHNFKLLLLDPIKLTDLLKKVASEAKSETGFKQKLENLLNRNVKRIGQNSNDVFPENFHPIGKRRQLTREEIKLEKFDFDREFLKELGLSEEILKNIKDKKENIVIETIKPDDKLTQIVEDIANGKLNQEDKEEDQDRDENEIEKKSTENEKESEIVKFCKKLIEKSGRKILVSNLNNIVNSFLTTKQKEDLYLLTTLGIFDGDIRKNSFDVLSLPEGNSIEEFNASFEINNNTIIKNISGLLLTYSGFFGDKKLSEFVEDKTNSLRSELAFENNTLLFDQFYKNNEAFKYGAEKLKEYLTAIIKTSVNENILKEVYNSKETPIEEVKKFIDTVKTTLLIMRNFKLPFAINKKEERALRILESRINENEKSLEKDTTKTEEKPASKEEVVAPQRDLLQELINLCDKYSQVLKNVTLDDISELNKANEEFKTGLKSILSDPNYTGQTKIDCESWLKLFNDQVNARINAMITLQNALKLTSLDPTTTVEVEEKAKSDDKTIINTLETTDVKEKSTEEIVETAVENLKKTEQKMRYRANPPYSHIKIDSNKSQKTKEEIKTESDRIIEHDLEKANKRIREVSLRKPTRRKLIEADRMKAEMNSYIDMEDSDSDDINK